MRKGRERSIPAPEGYYGCARCRTVKPLAAFSRQAKGPGGHGSYCKTCRSNLQRERREAGSREITPAHIERFWERVDKNGPNGCWTWTAYNGRRGYGAIWVSGFLRYAHIVSWEIHGGAERPPGMVLDHTCRNKLCVNPAHLRIVTHRQNALENNDTPFSRNRQKTECKNGHPFTPENTAVTRVTGPTGTKMLARTCLTCWPHFWAYAIVERTGPPRAKIKWRGPQTV